MPDMVIKSEISLKELETQIGIFLGKNPGVRRDQIVIRLQYNEYWQTDGPNLILGKNEQIYYSEDWLKCPKCLSNDVMDCSESLDCNNCGNSW